MYNSQILLALYFVLSLIHLWAGQFRYSEIAFYSKPILMLLLAFWFYLSTKNHPSFFRNLITGALLFSFGGDTLLMFVESKGEHFFLLGLGSFLLAHLCYLFAFFKYKSKEIGWLKSKPIFALPLLFLLIGFNSYLIPAIAKEMQIPVLVYSLVISLMAFSIFNLGGKINTQVFKILFAGALLFMFSDMTIAVNKFKMPIPYSHICIMLTYLLGQFFIVKASNDLAKTGS